MKKETTENRLFEFKGNNYEVKYWLQDDNETYRVRVFLDNKYVGPSYDITKETLSNGRDSLKSIMALAEKEFKRLTKDMVLPNT